MRRVMLIALALVAALGLTASTATAETGITAKNVTIGGTFPLTGPASALRADPGRHEGVLLLHQRPQGS